MAETEDGAPRPPRAEPWHLDRKVPIALILAILLQTFGAIWWAATQESRLASLSSDVARVEKKIDDQKDDPVRLARLEGFREDLARRLDRFEAKLDKLIDERTK